MNNVLNELLPRTVRLWLYVLVGVLAGAFSAWQIADGNVVEFVGGLVAMFSSWLAAGNISPRPPVEAPPVVAELADLDVPEVDTPPPHVENVIARHAVYEKNERGSGRQFYPDVFDQDGN